MLVENMKTKKCVPVVVLLLFTSGHVSANQYSPASDVWAYGIVLAEIYTMAATPYEGWGNDKVWKEVKDGYRLPQPADAPDSMYEIMQQCWSSEVSERPSLDSLELRLSKIVPGMRTMESRSTRVSDFHWRPRSPCITTWTFRLRARLERTRIVIVGKALEGSGSRTEANKEDMAERKELMQESAMSC